MSLIDSRHTYGSPRVHAELTLGLGLPVNHKRVTRLMRQAGIQGLYRRRRRGCTIRDPDAAPSSDLVDRNFTVTEPNRLWVTDITEHPTREGTLYCAAVMDASSRLIVGWSIAEHMRTELVTDALGMAIIRRRKHSRPRGRRNQLWMWWCGDVSMVLGAQVGVGIAGRQGVSGDSLAQRGHDVDAVLAGGVDVAADVQAILGDVFAGQLPGDLLLCLGGPEIALADVVRGPNPGIAAEPKNVMLVVGAELQQFPSGTLRGGVARPGHKGYLCRSGLDCLAELCGQFLPDLRVDFGELIRAGGMPGGDQAAQRALRLGRPVGIGVGLGGIGEITQ
ncbi:MAG: IS3 family transposase [Actinomycetota bacterium]|nr:IS3 family transposase [Actinomycetota bacterium]